MAVQISGNDITVPRDGSFTRNVTIGGTLTYEDVTNIDSVGLVTARSGIEIGARPGVAASISVDGNMIVSGISTFNSRVLLGTTTEGQANADDLTVAGSSNSGITIRSGTSSFGQLFFSDGTSGDDEYRGIVGYSHADNFMKFHTNAVERLRIDSSGRLLLGTTTEGEANADDLTIAGSGHVGITIRAGTTSQSAIYMSDATSGGGEYVGNIIYDHSDNHMRFATAETERLRILSNGRVAIGNATNNAAAAAIFGVIADDGEAADLYVGQFKNLEATAGQSYGLNVQAGSNSTDHGFRVMNRANDTTQFLVRGDGQVTKPAQFHIVVQRSGNQTGYNPSQGFGTGITFNNVAIVQGTTSAALNTSNGRVTVPVDGIYFLEASGYSDTAVFTQGWFIKNGSRLSYSDFMDNVGNSQNVNSVGFHKLAANDEIGFKAYGSSSTSATIVETFNHTWMRITLVG